MKGLYRVPAIRNSADVANGDGHAIVGQIELEFLDGAGKKLTAETLTLTGGNIH